MYMYTYIYICVCVSSLMLSVCARGTGRGWKVLVVLISVYPKAFTSIYIGIHMHALSHMDYGVATISRLLKIIRLFCRRAL